MAPVFPFDAKLARKDQNYPKSPQTIAKLVKTLTAKKVPKPQIDRFVTQLKAYNFSPITSEANRYVMKNLKGKEFAPVTDKPNMAQKASIVALFGPQALVLTAKFDLSVHLKGNDLQLWNTDCKGAKTVLFAAGP